MEDHGPEQRHEEKPRQKPAIGALAFAKVSGYTHPFIAIVAPAKAALQQKDSGYVLAAEAAEQLVSLRFIG